MLLVLFWADGVSVKEWPSSCRQTVTSLEVFNEDRVDFMMKSRRPQSFYDFHCCGGVHLEP